MWKMADLPAETGPNHPGACGLFHKAHLRYSWRKEVVDVTNSINLQQEMNYLNKGH